MTGKSRDRTPVGEVKYTAAVQSGPGAHPGLYKMSLCRGGGRGVAFTTHPHLAQRSRKEMIYASTPFVNCSNGNFYLILLFWLPAVYNFLSLSFYFLILFRVKFISIFFLSFFLSLSLFLSSFLFLSFLHVRFIKKCVRLLSHNLFSTSVLIYSEHCVIQIVSSAWPVY